MSMNYPEFKEAIDSLADYINGDLEPEQHDLITEYMRKWATELKADKEKFVKMNIMLDRLMGR